MSKLTLIANEIAPSVVALIVHGIVAVLIVSLCDIKNIGSSLSFGIVIYSLLGSYTLCVPVWLIEPGIQYWLNTVLMAGF